MTGVAAAVTLPIIGCAARRTSLPPTPGSPYGKALGAQLESVAGIYPDADVLALMRATAGSPNPSPQQLEVCWGLLGGYGQMPDVPQPIPPHAPLQFPLDHGLHFDTSIEWYYVTMSLPLTGGGTVSLIGNFFRKALAPAALVPGASALERTIFSTSIAVTVELPSQAGAHYAWPVQTYFGTDPAVRFGGSPFIAALGHQSISGGADVFPAHLHFEDAGDASAGRPPIVIDIEAAASNPLFLQGLDGFDGSKGAVGYYYYSWPQQQAHGTVSIDGTRYGTEGGRVWMDHQWGGAQPSTSGPAQTWTGWSWCEYQFDGGKSLTNTNLHGAIVGGIDTPSPGFGTYVDGGTSELIGSNLTITGYTQSPYAQSVQYPTGWILEMAAETPVPLALLVVPVANVKPQALLMGGLVEYAEAAVEVTAVGTIGGAPVSLSGVGYCESVGFEDPALTQARQVAFLQQAMH